MAISQEQQKRGLEHLKQIRRKYFNTSSEAADWWDKLTPEWRGVVLHAAAVNSGLSVFKAHLSKCCWRELFERLDYRAMIQLRCGISRARLTMNGFGSLRDSDFSKSTAICVRLMVQLCITFLWWAVPATLDGFRSAIHENL